MYSRLFKHIEIGYFSSFISQKVHCQCVEKKCSFFYIDVISNYFVKSVYHV